MNNFDRRNGGFGPQLIVAAMLATLGGFYGKTLLPYAFAGPVAGAVLGLLWALLIGWLARRPMLQKQVVPLLSDAPLALGAIILGLMTGAGLMYNWMMAAALNEPSTSHRILSALMWPAVPFYIALNSAMELVLVPLLVFWSWESNRWRKTLVLVGVAVYFAMRVWTYLVFAEARLDIAQHELSPSDVQWFRHTLASDFRIVFDMVSYVCLTLAGFASTGRSWSRRLDNK